jgi:hypothetical protein
MKSEMARICDSAPIVEAPFSLTFFKAGSKEKTKKCADAIHKLISRICELCYSSGKELLPSF